MKTTAAALTALALISAAPAHAISTLPSPPKAMPIPAVAGADRLEARIGVAVDKLKADDDAGARADLQAIIDDPAFSALTVRRRGAVYYFLSFAEAALDETQAAYDHMKMSGELAPEDRDGGYWRLLALLAWELDKSDEFVSGITVLVTDYPKDLAMLDSQTISAAIRHAADLPDGSAKKRALLEALRAAHYKAENDLLTEEWYWFQLFEIYVDAGETAKAQPLVAGFTMPGIIRNLHIDKRFAPYVAGRDRLGDYTAAVEAGEARLRRQVAAEPRKLETVIYLADSLSEGGQPQVAVALLEAALAKIDAAAPGQPAFDDQDRQWHWALATYSQALERLGRRPEAEAAQVKSRDESLVRGKDMISQRVNLGDFYYAAGRPQEALASVEGIVAGKGISPYGMMAVEEVRACAYAQLGDGAKLAASLDYMRAHADDGYGPMRSALMCAGKEDELAALVIARLEDPETRTATLVDLQTWLPEPFPTAIDAQLWQMRSRLPLRPDVKAVIDKYGVIYSWPTYSRGN